MCNSALTDLSVVSHYPVNELWLILQTENYGQDLQNSLTSFILYDLKLVTESVRGQTEVKSENNFVIDFYRAGILSAIAAIAVCWRTDEMQV